jgi:glutaminase A-like protein
VWDRILGLNLIPAKVVQTEIRFYEAHLNRLGLPLDNRRDYTKLNWEVWAATLAENRDQFNTLIAPLQRFVNETPSRVPMTDWYSTTDAKQSGFQARSVVGGVYIPLIAAPDLWKKWASQAQVPAPHSAARFGAGWGSVRSSSISKWSSLRGEPLPLGGRRRRSTWLSNSTAGILTILRSRLPCWSKRATLHRSTLLERPYTAR